jgi:hypothetical protein
MATARLDDEKMSRVGAIRLAAEGVERLPRAAAVLHAERMMRNE